MLVALAAAVAACGDDPGETAASQAPELAGVVRSPSLEVAEVTMPDAEADGEVVTMKADPGELLLVYFGYTSCPDICPTTMSDISVALGDLPAAEADRVTVAMVTVDPERDTGEVLGGYLDSFFDRRLALRTEDPDQLEAATEAFGVRFEVEDHGPEDRTYDVAHSAVTYVVDDTGTVAVEWPFGFDSRDMTSDLTTLLQEETP